MADHLAVFQHDNVYRIQWVLSDGDDTGAILGEDVYTHAQLSAANGDDRDHIAATIAAGKADPDGRSSDGYYWHDRSGADAALRACKVAMKAAASSVPWPDWAVKAAAAGWKAPKGWKP